MDQVSPEERMKLLPKVSDKLRTSIGDYHLRNSVKHNARYVDLHILLYSVLGIDRYEMGRFGESVHDHPN
jgi:hypothetical protein